ncbi:MAG TPA: SDR family NAD(P)-dependent oxidoreductase [Terriglobia bacterium]|nr:SDR family NAD(P)-dependent oxidoreductase [Terriglobia bacterium]
MEQWVNGRHNTDLAGKTAVITGGGSGIGRAIAHLFALEGARVISVDIDAAANAETARMIRESGGSCEAVEGDVSRAQDVKRAFQLAGRVDVLVNNAAAIAGDGRLHEISEEAWDRVLAICLKSVYLCSRVAIEGMMAQRAGAIVNLSSVNALTGVHFAAYTAAKGAILSLTRLMALEYGPYGIRVNAICPGTIMTESTRRYCEDHPEGKAGLLALYPGGAFGEPADIAECALYLASRRAKFMNGSVVVVDGGMSAIHRIEPFDPGV